MRRNALIGWQQVAFAMMVCLFASGSQPAELPREKQSLQTTKEAGRSVLTTAEQVHRLTREDAAHQYRAVIRGVVTCSLPESEAAVVQDSTRGIYVDRLNPALGRSPQVGELLEIEGVTDPGEFAPQVHAHKMTRLGVGELPPAIHPTWDQLINGSLDTQYVEMQGIVTSVHADGLTLLTHGGKIQVLLPATTGTNGGSLTRYENSLIALRGCLFAS